jgi:hypothetical protein
MTLGALLLLPIDTDEPFGIRTVVAADSWFSVNWPRLQAEIRADALIVAERPPKPVRRPPFNS